MSYKIIQKQKNNKKMILLFDKKMFQIVAKF